MARSTSRRGASTPRNSSVLDKRLAATPRAQRALARLADRPLNFDPVDLQGAGPNTGWHIDDYGQPLPAERPGEPVCGASFEIARRLMRDYAFADPAIVRAVFDPASNLANRNMLLEVRFGPLRCLLGCRIGAIVDETRTVDGRYVRIWGWGYGTLAGHLERGQMEFAVWKWLDDGRRHRGVPHPCRLAPGAGGQPARPARLSARRPAPAGPLRAARLRAYGRARRA